VNRTLVLMHKLCNGKVPAFHNDIIDEKDKQLIIDIHAAKTKVENNIEEYKFREALFEVIDLARKGNKYMQEKEPWILAKNIAGDPSIQKTIDNCIHLCLQLTANLAILVNPFLPFTAKKLLQQLKIVERVLDWENAGSLKLLSVGYSLRPPELLFRKIEDEEIEKQIIKLKKGLIKMENQDQQPTEKKEEPQIKPTIQFEDFAKIDLRTGTILEAVKVEKADKLLKLSIDLGTEVRTIVSGIALHFKPEEIIGKQVIVVANLAPRKMRGIESNGMILMAEDENGKLFFISPETMIPAGSAVS